jgi:hypothetical protein
VHKVKSNVLLVNIPDFFIGAKRSAPITQIVAKYSLSEPWVARIPSAVGSIDAMSIVREFKFGKCEPWAIGFGERR